MTDKIHYNWAWGRLMLMLAVSWVASYLLILGLIKTAAVSPDAVLNVATGGVRHVSIPIVEAGVEKGVPVGMMFFAVNFSVSMVFILLLVASPLLDPGARDEFPSLIRRILTRKSSLDKPLFWVLGFLPSFRNLGNEELQPVTVWLNVAPAAAMTVLGIELGAVTAAVQIRFGSLLFAVALLVPHCVLELPALCLAGSLPFGAYRSLRDDAANGSIEIFFDNVRTIIQSSKTRVRIALVPCLLLVAGVVEHQVTPVVASWVAKGM
jgi:hypothetical protein